MNTGAKQTENVTQCGNKSKPLLVVAVKNYQYKSDKIQKIYQNLETKPYRFIITELSIAWHDFYFKNVIKNN